MIRKQKNAWDNLLIHTALWSVVFILPYFFVDSDKLFNWVFFVRSIPEMLGFMLVFYINYFLFIERFLFRGKVKEFVLYNILLIVAVAFLMHYGRGLLDSLLPHIRSGRRLRGRGFSIWWFVLKYATSLFLMLGLSTALKMTVRWQQVENERKELEKAKSEAELQNLKNQINPHFLLNTLNNIYALIEFDPPKAQTAVMDLSKLLRHLLYDNRQSYVPLRQDANFIQNYIQLMRLRLADNVTVTTRMYVSETSKTMISPLIFISLIENAFKHGVSGSRPSFIDVVLRELPHGRVEFVCRNSYFPKTVSDKSGSGIGLDLVKKRLELLYPGNYSWRTNITDNEYATTLIIETKKEQK